MGVMSNDPRPAGERFTRGSRNFGIKMPRGKYEKRACEAHAALDQRCRARAIVLVDDAPLCHFHARQAFDRALSSVARLDVVSTKG